MDLFSSIFCKNNWNILKPIMLRPIIARFLPSFLAGKLAQQRESPAQPTNDLVTASSSPPFCWKRKRGREVIDLQRRRWWGEVRLEALCGCSRQLRRAAPICEAAIPFSSSLAPTPGPFGRGTEVSNRPPPSMKAGGHPWFDASDEQI